MTTAPGHRTSAVTERDPVTSGCSAPLGVPDLDVPAARTCPRRPLVLGAVGLAAAALVSACGGASDTTSPASTEGSSGSSSASSAGGAAPAVLVALADVPVGGAVSAESPEGDPIIIAQPTAGQVVGFSAVCTHAGCTVAPAGAELDCPCHGSVFDAATGQNTAGPAPSPLAAYAVAVSGTDVVTA